MDSKFKLAIEDYQCSGCVSGSDISCFKNKTDGSIGCGDHHSGTITSDGKIFLGMPKGFNRLGEYTRLSLNIYDTFESYGKYDMWNIPVWKHLSKAGHTFVRGIIPRKNEPFIHIFLENCIDQINCLEITQDDIDYMD